MSSAARKLVWPAAVTAAAFALTCWLGTWQLRRLEWKEALIARIESRASAPSRPLPARENWPALTPPDYDFTHVTARGRFDLAREALIFTGPPKGLGEEPGYFVVTPFLLAEGGAVLVDRGFIPASKRSSNARRETPQGEASIAAVMRAPQSRNAFTPADAPEKGEFYTADPAAISSYLKVEGAAPFMLTLDPPGETLPAAELPRPVAGGPEIVNNHLSYAVTWFSLAAAVVVIFLVYARGVARAPAGGCRLQRGG